MKTFGYGGLLPIALRYVRGGFVEAQRRDLCASRAGAADCITHVIAEVAPFYVY